MATPSEKLADSLDELRNLQDKGMVAIKSDNLSRTHRERLVENKFIEEVFRGWYIAISPNATQGDTTSWYSSFWDFCAQHLEDRFGPDWCISPEQSLLLHSGNTTVPSQLLVRSPKANNQTTPLLYSTSLFLLRADMPAENEQVKKNGLRMFSIPAALVRCSPNTFTQNAIDARTALSLINDASELLSILLDGGHSVIAGRLAGGFRNIGKDRIADTITETMEKAGYTVRETDPFDTKLSIPLSSKVHSPYKNRIKLMWEEMRVNVLPYFPAAPGLPTDTQAYLKAVEEVYVTDAYHSLSIEKYKVTPELIERVRTGTWNTNIK